jgi:hypothetical protein
VTERGLSNQWALHAFSAPAGGSQVYVDMVSLSSKDSPERSALKDGMEKAPFFGRVGRVEAQGWRNVLAQPLRLFLVAKPGGRAGLSAALVTGRSATKCLAF